MQKKFIGTKGKETKNKEPGNSIILILNLKNSKKLQIHLFMLDLKEH